MVLSMHENVGWATGLLINPISFRKTMIFCSIPNNLVFKHISPFALNKGKFKPATSKWKSKLSSFIKLSMIEVCMTSRISSPWKTLYSVLEKGMKFPRSTALAIWLTRSPLLKSFDRILQWRTAAGKDCYCLLQQDAWVSSRITRKEDETTVFLYADVEHLCIDVSVVDYVSTEI